MSLKEWLVALKGILLTTLMWVLCSVVCFIIWTIPEWLLFLSVLINGAQ